MAAIRIKVLFRVGLELALVAKVDQELLSVQGITDEVFTTVFRDKPVNDTETEGCLTGQIGKDLVDLRIRRIEPLQTRDDQFGLAFDFTFAGVRVSDGRKGRRGIHCMGDGSWGLSRHRLPAV